MEVDAEDRRLFGVSGLTSQGKNELFITFSAFNITWSQSSDPTMHYVHYFRWRCLGGKGTRLVSYPFLFVVVVQPVLTFCGLSLTI